MTWIRPKPKNQRLPEQYYQDPELITFITIHAFQNTRPFVEEKLNHLILEALQEEQHHSSCNIYTYCLMPDHIHYLVSPAGNGSDVILFTDRFKGRTTNVSWKIGWVGRLWQPRFFDTVMRSTAQLHATAAYILDNPYRKNIIPRDELWKWSGEFTSLP
jgi:putative transposase